MQLILYQPIHSIAATSKKLPIIYGGTGFPESPRIGFIPIWNWVRDSLKPEHLKSDNKLKGFLS